MHHSPSIHDIHIMLLCSSLDGSNFLIGDDYAGIVVGDVSEATFSDEKTCIWCNGVNVLFELMSHQLPQRVSAQPRIRADSQIPSALEAFDDALTTASNFSSGIRGMNFVNPNDL